MAVIEFGQVFAVLCVLVVILIAARLFFRRNMGSFVSKTDLTGKTAIITGANSGIGYYTALDLAKRNARVILACRDEARAERGRENIVKESGNENVVVRLVDVSLMSSVRKFAERIAAEEERLDILVNNAGITSFGQKEHALSDEGLERIIATNHFGPFLLTNLLLDLMKKSAPSRIVIVSSVMHKFGKIELDNLLGAKHFLQYRHYFDSKLANILFTRELGKRLEGTGVTVNALHPGTIDSDIHRHSAIRVPLKVFLRYFCKSAEEGAQTSLYLAVSEEVKDISGKYFSECDLDEKGASDCSKDMELAGKLWSLSEQVTGLSSS